MKVNVYDATGTLLATGVPIAEVMGDGDTRLAVAQLAALGYCRSTLAAQRKTSLFSHLPQPNSRGTLGGRRAGTRRPCHLKVRSEAKNPA